MAFGFPPTFHQTSDLNDLSKEQFLFLAIEVAQQEGWDIGTVTEHGFTAYTWYRREKIRVYLEDHSATMHSTSKGNQIYDNGQNRSNILQLSKQIDTLKTTLSPDALAAGGRTLTETYFTTIPEPYETTGDQSDYSNSGLIPRKNFLITPILAGINILVFTIMAFYGADIFQPDNQSLLDWGANFRPMTLEGDWWRLFTACFIHIGIFHLLLNMYALLYIGLLLEPYLGKTRFITAYILSGVAASLVSLCWHDLSISAGASGAIFGMYGVFLALLTANFIDKSAKKAFLASTLIFILYNIANGFKPGSGIDNAAHIGGLLSGMVIGYIMIPSLRQYYNNTIKFASIALLSITLLLAGFYSFRHLPNDIVRYEEKMQRFISMEAMALEVLQRPEGTPKTLLLSELKERGIYYWKESLLLMEDIERMKLPEPLLQRNVKMKAYCELRINSYELIYKSIKEDTDRYESDINRYVAQIETIIRELTEQ